MTINQKRPEHITATDPSAISIMDAPMPYQVLNEQGECIAVNQTLLDVLGYARQDLIGKNFAEIIHPGRVDHFKRNFSNIRATAAVCQFEFEIVQKNGATILVSFNGKVQRDAQGRFERMHCILQDITERKNAEQMSLEREQYLKSILQTVVDGFWVVDRHGMIIDVNEAYCRMSGYTQTELLAMAINDIDAIETPDDTRERIRRIMLNGSAIFETCHRRKDGSSFKIEISVTFLNIKGGQFICFGRDVTERQESIEALQESEERFKTIIENLPGGVFAHDFAGRLLIVNAAAAKNTGYTVQELRALNVADIDSGGYTRDDRELLWNSLSIGEVLTIDSSHTRKDGSQYPAEIHLNAIMLDRQPAILAIAFDISERRQVEAALSESEEKHRSLFNQSAEGIFLHDVEGKILDVNQMACMQTGYTKAELLRLTVFDLHSAEPGTINMPQKEVLRIWQQWQPGQIATVQAEHRRKDGTPFPVEVSIGLIQYGERSIIQSIVKDISDRKALEARLLQAQKMESIGRLAGGVAHDYNNMLSVIVGYTEMALEKIRPEDPLYAELMEVYQAGKRSTDITRQLLAFARKQTIDPKAVDLNNIVESMLRMLSRLIGEDIDLNWRPGSQLWLLKMDPAQVDQILVNLCVNARDAIGGVGEVTIETRNFTIDEVDVQDHVDASPGDYVMLAVSDNGVGMDKETLDNIFEPFFTTKGISEGTGLGLPTVYGIVKQNNGFVSVYSEPGGGTIFRIYLPRLFEAQPQRASTDRTAAPSGRGETVLLVEDELSILRLGEMMLKRLGYRVLSSGTPSQAIQMASESKIQIDLLMTDVVMPEMNGRQLAEHLNALFPSIRTLFMSGYTADVIAHRGVLDEGMHFIQKPFSLRDLGVKVRTVLDDNS